MLRLLLIFLMLPFTSTYALVVDTPLTDPQEEARAQALFHHFRCVVCQSESVADSPADVAKDVRAKVREYVHAGKSDEDIKTFLVTSYGEFILMKPEYSSNLLLWLMPILVLMAGSGLLFKTFRKPSS